MSNYSTSYNISQTGDLYTLQDHGTSTGQSQYNSSRGTTVNSPLNYRKLEAFKGLDNEFWFYVKNQDRKPIMLNNLTINASLIFRENKNTIVAKECTITDYDLGTCKLVLKSSDIADANSGLYDLVLTYKNAEGLVLPLFADTNMRPTLTVEISEDAFSVPLTTQTTTTWLYDGSTNNIGEKLNGPKHYQKVQGLITFAVYTTGYTGKFFLQGATSPFPDDSDWFNLELGAATDYHQFNAFTGIEPFTITSNLYYVRFNHQVTGATGTVDKVVIRL